MVIRPIVAVVAADEPETAAKIPQPITLTCISRPGIRVIHGESPLNMSSARRVRNRIPPIQMNSGRAVSDHDQDCPDRKSVVLGKSVSVRVDLGGLSII